MSLSGAAAAPAMAADDDKVVFTVALTNEADSFNPYLGIEAESFEMWGLMYDYLISYNMEDLSLEPSLATEWDTSEDGKTWTFTLRDGVMWSDGEPLTADDVAATFNRIIDGGPEAATWGSYLGGVEAVTAPDDTTVVVLLKKPNAIMPYLPIPILPEHVWKDVSEKQVKSYANEPTDGQPVVGSGPFRLVEGTAGGSTYRFEKNPDYWGGASHLDEVVFRVYKAQDPAAQAIIKGDVDFLEEVSSLVVDRLAKEDNIETNLGLTPSFNEISFNAGSVNLKNDKPIGDVNPAVLDPKFRHALGFALDLDQVIKTAYTGAAEPGDVIVPPSYGEYHWSPPEDEAFTFDLDRAGELLDEAGYTMGSDGKRTMPDGSPIAPLRMFARSDSSGNTSLDTLDLFSEWIGDLGIDSTVRTVESSKLTEIILDGDFDVFEWGWYVDPDPDGMLSYMTCGQRGNWSDSWYCNDEYDRLYQAQREELDPDKRVEMIKQMQQILFEDSPYLVTAYDKTGEVVRSDRFACFRQQPDPGGVWLQQYGVYNYLNIRPAAEAGDCGGEEGVSQASAAAEEEGTSTGVLVGVGVGVVVLLGIGGVVMMRRRATVEDRE